MKDTPHYFFLRIFPVYNTSCTCNFYSFAFVLTVTINVYLTIYLCQFFPLYYRFMCYDCTICRSKFKFIQYTFLFIFFLIHIYTFFVSLVIRTDYFTNQYLKSNNIKNKYVLSNSDRDLMSINTMIKIGSHTFL